MLITRYKDCYKEQVIKLILEIQNSEAGITAARKSGCSYIYPCWISVRNTIIKCCCWILRQ
ncbi:MAG: hypothetical protein NC124_09565 [Clostridium sp.]|nr:hypothetical protein [Clostridium sp.]